MSRRVVARDKSEDSFHLPEIHGISLKRGAMSRGEVVIATDVVGTTIAVLRFTIADFRLGRGRVNRSG